MHKSLIASCNRHCRTLGAMGFEVVVEVLEPRSRYSIDIWLPLHKVAVEVDGPFHYSLTTKPRQDESGSPTGVGELGMLVRGQRPVGSTALKRRHLSELGVELVAVPYWEWDVTVSLQDKVCRPLKLSRGLGREGILQQVRTLLLLLLLLCKNGTGV